MVVVKALDRARIKFFHVPNERRDESTRIALSSSGVKPGVPDLVIIDPPPGVDAVGAVIEMKRREGGKVSRVQEQWLDWFEERGWVVAVCEGAAAALDQLRTWGYLIR